MVWEEGSREAPPYPNQLYDYAEQRKGWRNGRLLRIFADRDKLHHMGER